MDSVWFLLHCYTESMKSISKLEWISGVLFLVLGIGCFLFPVKNADAFFYLIAGLVSISFLGLLWNAIRSRTGQSWIMAGIAGLAAGFLWFHRQYPSELIGLFFSFYIFFNFLVEAIQAFLDFRNESEDKWEHTAMTAAYLVLFVISVSLRRSEIRYIMYYFGVYLLIQAMQSFAELYMIRHPHSSRTYSMNRWVSLPVYFVFLLPYLIVRSLEKDMKEDKAPAYDEKKNDLPVNVRVFIHSGTSGSHMVGHMTFSYKGIMYSYGNYDAAEEKLFRTIGPGILFTVPADVYVNNSCIYEQSILFEFGLHLNEQQEKKLQELLQKTMDQTYRWYSEIEQENGWREFDKLEKDYACRLHYRTGAKFRKFHQGQWKTYWVMGDNCSLFAENILSAVGCEIVHKNGIVTPGEYFEFFQEAYADPKSNVVYRSWHSASVPSTLYPTLA